MLVFVAEGAFAAEAEKCFRQVLLFDFGARGCGDALRAMTGFAFLLAMFSLEGEAGLFLVVELVAVEPDEGESLSVMVHVAARAIRFAGRGVEGAAMKSDVGLDALPDFRVALEALKAPATRSEVVAGRALGDTLELFVGVREGTGRELRPADRAAAQRQHQPK